MKKNLIIGLVGKARSGKDTVGQMLVRQHGFVRDALADDLKIAALALDPWIRRQDQSFLRLSELIEQVGWESAKANPEVRTLLQRLGTEAGWRMHGQNLWTDRVEARIKAEPNTDRVITDIRMPHEADWLHDVGGILMRITRPDHQGTTGANSRHESETGVDAMAVDIEVFNDGSLADLETKVNRLVQILHNIDSPSELIDMIVL